MNYLERLYATFNLEDLYLVLISILIGLVIGSEREYWNKSAGLRTLMLVSVGSCIFTIVSMKIGGQSIDRIASNIVTGIGFLGAGAIFKDDNKVNGLTTACTIWVTAALGMSVGSHQIFLGIFGAIVVLIVLWNLVALEKWIDNLNYTKEYKITTKYHENIFEKLEETITNHHLKFRVLSREKTENHITLLYKIRGLKKRHKKLITELMNDNSISNLII